MVAPSFSFSTLKNIMINLKKILKKDRALPAPRVNIENSVRDMNLPSTRPCHWGSQLLCQGRPSPCPQSGRKKKTKLVWAFLCFCRPEGLLGQMNIFNMLTNMFLNAFNMTISLGELVLSSFLVDGSFDDQKYELEKIISALCSQYLSELQNDKILQPQDCNCLNLTIYMPAVQLEENYSFQSISSWFIVMHFLVVCVWTSAWIGKSRKMLSS